MALSDSDKIRLIEDHCRSFWEGDLQDFDHQLGYGFVDATAGFPAGVEGAKAWARACRRAIPGVRMTVTDALVAGDVVAVRATWSGAHTGEFPGRSPTGDQPGVDGIVVWRLDEHGHIVSRNAFGDLGAAHEAPGHGPKTPGRSSDDE